MPHEIQWYIPDRVMVIHLRGSMTIEELSAMADESVTYIKRGPPQFTQLWISAILYLIPID